MLKFLLLVSLLWVTPSCKEDKVIQGPKPRIVYREPTGPVPDARPVPRSGFVNLDLLEDTILLDLQTLDSDDDRRNTRYLVACDRHNSGDDLDEYRQGVDLGLNRLSAERFLTPVTAIGNAGCIYRINLEDYSITRFEWQLIEAVTLLDFVSKSTRNQNIQFLVQSQKGYIFGIELCAMFECDEVADKGGAVYYDLVNQPNLTQDFFEQQGVNVQDQVNAQNGTALFSGFSQSQIALGKTRLIQVAKSTNGYVMSSFDVALGGDDLFVNPFSQELINAGGRVNSRRRFKHAAQEHIATSNNGLTTWRLNNAADNAEVEAPTSVVTNTKTGKIDPAIRIGDCGNCHYPNVAIPFSDQLRNHILGNSAFDPNEKDLGRIFFNYDRISAIIDKINKRNRIALDELGITAEEDPLTEIFRNIREEMTADQVAAYTLLPTDQFLRLLTGSAVSSQVFGNLLNGGTVNIATLSDNFNTLVVELNLFDDGNL